jgi:hypothetical protein
MISLHKKLLGFFRSTRGSTALSLAVAAPTMFAAIGVGVDFANFSYKKAQLQAAADASAVASVKELAVAGAKTNTIAIVADQFARAQIQDKSIKLRVEAEPDSKQASVKVTLTETWIPFFAHFLGADVTPIRVKSTARLAGKTNICILALHDDAAKAFHMNKRAKVEAHGCAVYSNSTHTQGIRLDDSANLKAPLVCAVGGVFGKKASITPEPTMDCPKVVDPLADRLPPKIGPCIADNLVLKSGDHKLKGGTYCGGIKIRGTAKVTFEEGDFVIQDGVFEVSGNATAIAKNSAFYLSGEQSTIRFVDDTTIDFTGAKTGPMAGLLFFEDRTATRGRLHKIKSSNANVLTGTIYLPAGELVVDPNMPVATDSAYTAIIARTIQLTEGPTLVLNSDYSSTNVPVPAGISLSSQVVLSD